MLQKLKKLINDKFYIFNDVLNKIIHDIKSFGIKIKLDFTNFDFIPFNTNSFDGKKAMLATLFVRS